MPMYAYWHVVVHYLSNNGSDYVSVHVRNIFSAMHAGKL